MDTPEQEEEIVVPKPQAEQSLEPRDYNVRLIVAGSRGFNDRKLFHRALCAFMQRFGEEKILFISGDADSGADDLIKRWCAKFGYPCKRMPADWDNEEYKTKSGKSRAGFVRNTDMAKIATHLLNFYDGSSPGSTHMIDEAHAHGLGVKIILVKVPLEYRQRKAYQ